MRRAIGQNSTDSGRMGVLMSHSPTDRVSHPNDAPIDVTRSPLLGLPPMRTALPGARNSSHADANATTTKNTRNGSNVRWNSNR